MVKHRKLTGASAVASTNLTTKRAAMETVTQAAGNTPPGRRYDCGTMSACNPPKSMHEYIFGMLTLLICSAPRAVVEALATVVQFVGRQASLGVMTANAARGIN